jgi:thiamine biosynthesis lipoprotein
MDSEITAPIKTQALAQASLNTHYVVPAGLGQEQFRAMGTTITVFVPEGQMTQGIGIVKTLFDEWERTLSRFQPESELSRLNQRTGELVIVSDLLLIVLTQALTAARASQGVYDPTLLNQLAQIGYDRSFDQLPQHLLANAHLAQYPPMEQGGAWRHIQVNREKHSVLLPAGIRLDFGGIAKGMAVDAALEALQQQGIGTALVNAGGDLAVRGLPPGVDHWSIAIPGKDRAWALPLQHGAIATSGIARRQWQQGDRLRHHLLDPQTGLPADNGLWSTTVVAARCEQAEVAAKVAFIKGLPQGKTFVEDHRMASLFIKADGSWEGSKDWPMHLMTQLESNV